MKKLNIILALSLMSISANALAKESMVHQMWRFSYPDYNIPKQIPRHAKRAMADPYGNKQKDDVIFTDKENNDYYETITVDADYGNGYLLLHTRLADEERTFSYEVVAFKDSKGKYTFFKNDVSYLKGYGIADCTIYPRGRTFRSNRPLQKVFPKLTIQTFAPDVAVQSVKAPLFYLDMTFPRKGTTVTATIKPLGYLLKMDNPKPLFYGNWDNAPDYPDNLRNSLIAWVKHLNDKQSLNALINGQALNSDDEQALEKMLQSYVDSYTHMTQESTRKEAIEILQWFNEAYHVEKHLKFNRIALAWDRKQRRFHVAKKIPAKQSTASSFYDYLINLPDFKIEYTCFNENQHGYGYRQ